MKCFACNTICVQDAKFCLNCGHDLAKTSASQPRQSAPSSRHQANPYPYQASLAEWRDLKAKKLKNTFLLGSLVLFTAFAVWVMTGFGFAGQIVTLIACIWTVLLTHRVSQKNYYALPHALDQEGEHRCIFCGGRGIYRKGVYKSTTVHSNCSKCQQRLFTDLVS